LPRISVTGISMSVRVCVWCVCVLVTNGSLNLAARAIVLQAFFISLSDTKRCYGVSLCRSDASDQRRARCWLPFCAFFAAILWCQRVSTHHDTE
jgi:hypothetical protein